MDFYQQKAVAFRRLDRSTVPAPLFLLPQVAQLAAPTAAALPTSLAVVQFGFSAIQFRQLLRSTEPGAGPVDGHGGLNGSDNARIRKLFS